MNKSMIFAAILAALGLVGVVHASQKPAPAAAACCDGGACCEGGSCCVAR